MILANDSNHSTIAVDTSTKQSSNILVSLPESQSRSCKVRFDECQNEYFANDQRTGEECRTTWYHSEDYQQLRSNARELVLKANDRCSMTLGVDLKEIYEHVCHVDFLLEDASEILTPALEKKITEIFIKSSESSTEMLDLIGLESYVAAGIKKSCAQKREQIQDAVYDIQCEFEHGLWTKNEVEDELRESCLNFSQAACLFAQLLAKAQQAACV
mmetsp:Transcript_13457/g.17547  ORF Transcript_13457/g.17547 Transcript_13457/m.17547 type:complete len:215 (+) Transcript_13457:102-746(+)|eukprot:CAMPEP_0198149572 /NCGR_PEP_ID=MMETSP1443-20131203/47225_1 /TAXON_ID=186043 /ORGANISM="Entomoneis sp., Strain CCMP2396" /LENGTH=214 /DNA_ID=CAMNT_0043814653 /DNA_START=92 /DNA_END=736 /DNA_ORIENTATION=+